jgi:hypothetical protein
MVFIFAVVVAFRYVGVIATYFIIQDCVSVGIFHNIAVMVITVGTNSGCSAVFKTFNFSPVVLLIDS